MRGVRNWILERNYKIVFKILWEKNVILWNKNFYIILEEWMDW